MQTRVVTLGFDTEAGGFVNADAEQWLAGVDVLGVQSYFFEVDGRPWLTLIVNHRGVPDDDPLFADPAH